VGGGPIPPRGVPWMWARPKPPPGAFLRGRAPPRPRRYLWCATEPYRERHGPRWSLATRYLVAGVAYGLSATALLFVAGGIEFLPIRFVTVALLLVWPAITFALYATGISRAFVLAGTIAWAILPIVAAATAGVSSVEILVVGAVLVLPAAIVALLVANRVLRTTALSLYLVALAVVMPTLFALDIALLFARSPDGPTTVTGAVLVGVVAALVLGSVLGLLTTIAVTRLTRRASDLMLQADAMWLILGFWHVTLTIGASGVGALLLLVPFVVYRLTLALAGRVGRAATDPGRAPVLLVLRVFGDRAAKQRLAAGLLGHWRRYGPVVLLGAADLATETLDPQELSAFLTANTRTIFIESPADLRARLAAVREPMADGLYPVDDFYCRADTWQPTATALMALASTVVLDLRGFGPTNTGVQWEIGELVRRVPMERVTILADHTTDQALAEQFFHHAWQQHTGIGPAPPTGPGPGQAATLTFNLLST
ncbi:MAG: hypothetical protein AAF547_24125, partial [Actinomycetota bacterium]